MNLKSWMKDELIKLHLILCEPK